jgi:hypothetical protein
MRSKKIEILHFDTTSNHEENKYETFDITSEGLKKSKRGHKGLVDLQ